MNLKLTEKMHTSLVIAAAAAVLVGCSAGGAPDKTTGTGSTGGTTTTATPSIAVALSTTTVTSSQPATVTATVLDADKNPLTGVVVTFSDNAAIGVLSQTSALTDATGVATATLSPAVNATTGADTVTASTTVAGTAYTAGVGYQINIAASSSSITGFSVAATAGGTTALSAYGQSLLTLTLTGASSTTPIPVTVNSSCVTAGKATISPTTFSATSDSVQLTYKDNGCGAVLSSDTVTAAITGSTTSTPATVILSRPAVSNITFDAVDSTSGQIYLQGSGLTESASIKFKVVDSAGNALPNQKVSLSLSTYAGGLTIDGLTESQVAAAPFDVQTSDANGLVTAIVNSGTVPTPVTVNASILNSAGAVVASSLSSTLAVATGLPTQMGFGIQPTTVNIEGFTHLNVPDTFAVSASDRSHNPVADGTSIVFWAENGLVDPTVTTSDGTATAHFKSGPVDKVPADGRVTILAYAIGEESFDDLKGTNVYAAGDPFQDLGDVVKSEYFDGLYDPSHDETVSLSTIGAGGSQTCVASSDVRFAIGRTTPNNGATCDGLWSPRTYVRNATEIVLSSSTPNPLWASKLSSSPSSHPAEGLDGTCQTVNLFTAPQTIATGPNSDKSTPFYAVAGGDGTWHTGGQSSGTVQVITADSNTIRLNPMPAGTTVSATSNTPNFTVSVVGGSPVPSTSVPNVVALSYTFSAGQTSGNFTLSFTTPTFNITTTVGLSMDTASLVAYDASASPAQAANTYLCQH